MGTIKSGLNANTPDRIFVGAGAVYLNYGLSTERRLGATRGGNEWNLNREIREVEIDGVKGPTKGLRRVTVVRPQITCNLIELSLENLLEAIAGAEQATASKQTVVEGEYLKVGDGEAITDIDNKHIIENSERAFLNAVLLTRSAKYNSRFVGINAAKNKGFETGIGNWTSESDSTIEVVTGGKSGNCLKYTAPPGEPAAATLLTLPGGNGAQLTNLVEGQHYKLRVALKKDAYTPTITIACDAGSKALIAPATSWVVHVIEFKATGRDASITLTGSVNPQASEVLYVNYLELERVDGDYVMNWEEGEVVYAQDDIPEAGEELTISYTYASILSAVVFTEDGTGVKGTYVGHGLTTGDVICITGCTNAYANATWTITKDSDDVFDLDGALWASFDGANNTGDVAVGVTHDKIRGGDISLDDYIDNVALVGTISGKDNDVICIVENALADAGISLSTAPRDEAVPSIVFTGHYDPATPTVEPWEIRYPRA